MLNPEKNLQERLKDWGSFAIAPASLWYHLVTASSSGNYNFSGMFRFLGWTSTPVLLLATVPSAIIGCVGALGSLGYYPIEKVILANESSQPIPLDEGALFLPEFTPPELEQLSPPGTHQVPVGESFTLLDALHRKPEQTTVPSHQEIEKNITPGFLNG